MGHRYRAWERRLALSPKSALDVEKALKSRSDLDQDISLDYGDHGLSAVIKAVYQAIQDGKKIALYADYDVDGTMSCVSWVWFFQEIGYENFIYYIPDRFREGYGLNLEAIKKLVHKDKAELIITMDCGITANTEAEWCQKNGVLFICTDHHKVNPSNMPDCLILNPILHPDPSYQYLCGCGITYVLLRKLDQYYSLPRDFWVDLLALAGLATVCDVVPLNSVNHKLARLGLQALPMSRRPIIQKLLKEASYHEKSGLNEQDLGFKIGPRINAVGRLDHGHKIVNAFIGNGADDLIEYMASCNEERKQIQEEILADALLKAETQKDLPILFLGGDWHIGVIGIVASRLSEMFWKPVWLYSTSQEGVCKGSCRSIPGFDVADAMVFCSSLFLKHGGHAAAAGFSFSKEKVKEIRESLCSYGESRQLENKDLWVSSAEYDFSLPSKLLSMDLLQVLDSLRPFGQGFPEPVFKVSGVLEKILYYSDKQTGLKKHTCFLVKMPCQREFKILFFNAVFDEIPVGKEARFLVTVQKNFWRGQMSLSLFGKDFSFL